MNTIKRAAFVACTFAWASFLSGCQSMATPAWELPPGVKTLDVNGYPMAYTERGRGPTIVLVHGAVNDYRYWDPQLESLAARYRVVSVSLRHYYPERWNGDGEDFSVQLHAQDLAAFVERMGAGPVYLVAHSRGGSVAAGTAKLRPDLVKKLVLAEPSLLSLAARPAGSGPDPAVLRARTVADMLKKGQMEAGLEYYIDGISARPGTWKTRSEAEKQVVRDNAWTIVGGARHSDIVNCDDLRNMRMPLLLVESEKGPAFLRNLINEAQKCAPSAQRILIPNAGHRMNRENIPAFDAAVTAFLGADQ